MGGREWGMVKNCLTLRDFIFEQHINTLIDRKNTP